VKWLVDHGIQFPLLCKYDNHEVFVIFNAEGLTTIDRFPAIIQEYVPHSDAMLKIYVLGDDICVTVKKSLPRLNASDNKSNWHFGRISQSAPEKHSTLPLSDQLNQQMVKLARSLRQIFGLSLFDFDVIVSDAGDSGPKRFVVVDVNPFPGFASMNHFNSRLLRHLAATVRNIKK